MAKVTSVILLICFILAHWVASGRGLGHHAPAEGSIYLSSDDNSNTPSLLLNSPGDVKISCAGHLDVFKCPLTQKYDLSRGLVAHYTFDDPSNLGQDSTSNAYDGQVVGTIHQSPGKVGNGSALFNGTFASSKAHHYISIPNILNRNAYTVALWTRLKAPDSHTSFLMLHGGAGFVNSNGQRRYDWGQSSFWFYTSHSLLAVIQNSYDMRYNDFPRPTTYPNLVPRMQNSLSREVLNESTWHHIATTFSEGRVSVYRDGKLAYEFSNISPVPVTPASQRMFIGDCLCTDVSHSTSYEINGLIDDYRIYNRALSDKEIMQLAGSL
ncbi:uncharacterized protein [Oscarella lobularis]|uniref:uncharacterized protein n=1 Tax=Oscarella lobularis TaxID=121494 RepID=UPI003313F343